MDNLLPPYKKGFLDVGPAGGPLRSEASEAKDGHKLYYECWGNPQGKPILYIHGGPGSGFSDNAKAYFDPTLWNVILFDQRGAGRSTPFASLSNNTTDDLVEDITKLLDMLHIKNVTLFGGSWGSTLSLVYAIRNPERISGMVLRGIFIPSKEDFAYMFGGGIHLFAPQAWERFVGNVPEAHKDNPAPYYFEKMTHGTKEEKEKFTFEWAYYEMSLMSLKTSEKDILENMKEYNYQSLSPLEAHYLLNNCFLPHDYILDNAPVLSGIPTVIIQGKYDLVCPPASAYDLHKKIKGSKLYLTIAGHASSDKANKKVIVRETAKMYKLVSSR